MAQADPQSRELGRRLLATEAGGSQIPVELASAATRCCQKLRQQFVGLIGPMQTQMLLDRALYLAKAELPSLDWSETQPQDCLDALDEATRNWTSVEVDEGLAAVLGNFIGLLTLYIGEDFVLRLIGRTWPDVSLDQEGLRPEEGGNG